MSLRRRLTASLQFLLYSPTSRDAEEIVGAYAFSATLSIQDITGSAHSGLSASHISKRLEGSAESDSLLFALTSVQAPRPLGPRGYPLISVDDLADIEAWVFISLPLLEDTNVIEAAITLDAAIAPLPGEPVPREPWNSALSLIDALSRSLSRPTRQIWETHAADSSTPAAPYLTEAGYTDAYQEQQATFTVEESVVSAAELPIDDINVVFNNEISTTDLDLFRVLLTEASKGYPRGDLQLDTVEWTPQRLYDAQARLLDRGGNQYTAIAFAGGENRKAVGLAEAVHYDADDDSLIELGLVFVLPEYRRAGIGSALVEAALSAAKHKWGKVETGYSSYPSISEAAHVLARRGGAQAISATTAWQRN